MTLCTRVVRRGRKRISPKPVSEKFKWHHIQDTQVALLVFKPRTLATSNWDP